MPKDRVDIIANTIIETGMSGGNRIFIECAKRWSENGVNIEVFTTEVGERLCKDNGLVSAKYTTWKSHSFKRPNAVLLYLIGTIRGYIFLSNKNKNETRILYSSSDFWSDSIPALIAKLKNDHLKWVAAFYLFAPSPFNREFPYKGKRLLTGLVYWLSQMPVYWLVRKHADMVFVTNEPDRIRFIDKRLKPHKVVAVRGGVETKNLLQIPVQEKKYDAVFIGRFHPQKGALELIDIWKHICTFRKDAVLAMIGIGELENSMRRRITEYHLDNNIRLLGFKDGLEKNKILKQSKVAVYPATLDHWSMAPVEAMICGLPLVTFDVPTLKFLNPKGMIRVPCYDKDAFARAILVLLNNGKLYDETREAAISWASEWCWDKRADYLLRQIRQA